MNRWIKHQQPDAGAEDRTESALNSSGVSALIESGKESLGSSQCTHNDFHTYLLSSVGPRQLCLAINNTRTTKFSTTSAYSEFAINSFICNVTATHKSSDKMQKDEKTKRGLHIKTSIRILDLLDVRCCHWLVLRPVSPVYTGNMLMVPAVNKLPFSFFS